MIHLQIKPRQEPRVINTIQSFLSKALQLGLSLGMVSTEIPAGGGSLPSPKHPPPFVTGELQSFSSSGGMARRQVQSPPAAGTEGSVSHIPGTGSAPRHRGSACFRRDFRFCTFLLLRKHFYCAEGWDGD